LIGKFFLYFAKGEKLDFLFNGPAFAQGYGGQPTLFHTYHWYLYVKPLNKLACQPSFDKLRMSGQTLLIGVPIGIKMEMG